MRKYGIRVVNMGISSNTVRDLKERWQTDVLDLKPDWLSIMTGINDVGRQYNRPTHLGARLGQFVRKIVQTGTPTRSTAALCTKNRTKVGAWASGWGSLYE
ncbi:GDSL-type esterase/lipase family protein [Paenibacillus nanensis]|uniref:GDSL-type esterase/lipase family protein n=1 Tax=Paenibacillus nanensis TaxID=393251 RepID=UPI003B835420